MGVYSGYFNESKEDKQQEIQKLWDKMDKEFNYGFKYKGKIIQDFSKYKTLSPDKFERDKAGVCWDYVAYEDKMFKRLGVKYNLYYIEKHDNTSSTHTWLAYTLDSKWYTFEVSWLSKKGIKEFNSEREMLNHYIDIFMEGDKVEYVVIKFKQPPQYNLDPLIYMDTMISTGSFCAGDRKYYNALKKERGDIVKTLNEAVKLDDKYKIIGFDDISSIKKYKADKYLKMTDRGAIAVDLDNNKVIGHVLVNRKGGGFGDLETSPKYRRQGIASALLEFIIKKYKADHMWVYTDNYEAIKLYEKYNFKVLFKDKTDDGSKEFYGMSLNGKHIDEEDFNLKNVNKKSVNEETIMPNSPIKIKKSYGVYSKDKKYNAVVEINGYSEKFRGRSEMLVVNDKKEVFLIIDPKSDYGYFLPGGSWDKNERYDQSAIRETKEEARINTKNVKYVGDYIITRDEPIEWVKNNIDRQNWWTGYYTKVYIGEYDGKYNGHIDDIDKDTQVLTTGRFYPIKDVYHKLIPVHQDALSDMYTSSLYESSTSNKSKVYFIKDVTPENVLKAFQKLDVNFIGKKVACKVHSGEDGNNNFLKPEFWKPIVDYVHGTIVETNTAYEGARDTTEKHEKLIKKHGWNKYFDVEILDRYGSLEIPVSNPYIMDSNYIGKGLSDYDSLLVLSHFKGHAMGGYGGALKQLSIGCASAQGKRKIHGFGNTEVGAELLANFTGKDEDVKDNEQYNFTESMADAASSVVDFMGKDNVAFINVMANISVDCDCDAHAHAPCMKDIGILVSTDPVAIDQACLDLVYGSDDPGKNKLIHRIESRHGEHTIEVAEAKGMGSRDYEIIDIEGNDPAIKYVNNVVFDLGSVLVSAENWKPILMTMNMTEEQVDKCTKAYVDFCETEDETYSLDMAKKIFKDNYMPDDMKNMADTVFEVCATSSKPFRYTIPLLQALKEQGKKIYYLSNWSKSGFELMVKAENMNFLKLFDGGLVSYQVGVKKPNREIYELFLDKYKLAPEDCIFFDDKKVNVSGAKAVGMHAEVFDHEFFDNELSKIGWDESAINEATGNIESAREFIKGVNTVIDSFLETKMSYKERKGLPDSAFGIPSERKYPLNDKEHVEAAIKMYNRYQGKNKDQLKRNIKAAAKKYGIEISEDSPINEANNIDIGSKYLEKKDSVYNFEKWNANSDHNILYVTGMSGSGKTTLAEDIAKIYNCERVELDYIVYPFLRRAKHREKEFDKLKAICPDAAKFLTEERLNKYTFESWGDAIPVVEEFFDWFLPTHINNGKLYVINGSQIPYVYKGEDLKDEPVIVKDPNLVKNVLRRTYRESFSDFSKYESFAKWFAGFKRHMNLMFDKGYQKSVKDMIQFGDDIFKYNESVLSESASGFLRIHINDILMKGKSKSEVMAKVKQMEKKYGEEGSKEYTKADILNALISACFAVPSFAATGALGGNALGGPIIGLAGGLVGLYLSGLLHSKKEEKYSKEALLKSTRNKVDKAADKLEAALKKEKNEDHKKELDKRLKGAKATIRYCDKELLKIKRAKEASSEAKDDLADFDINLDMEFDDWSLDESAEVVEDEAINELFIEPELREFKKDIKKYCKLVRDDWVGMHNIKYISNKLDNMNISHDIYVLVEQTGSSKYYIIFKSDSGKYYLVSDKGILNDIKCKSEQDAEKYLSRINHNKLVSIQTYDGYYNIADSYIIKLKSSNIKTLKTKFDHKLDKDNYKKVRGDEFGKMLSYGKFIDGARWQYEIDMITNNYDIEWYSDEYYKQLAKICKKHSDAARKYKNQLRENTTVLESHIQKNDTNPVYIIVMGGKSIISAPIKKFTNSEFSHSGLSFSPDLSKIFSFNMNKDTNINSAKTGISVESIDGYADDNPTGKLRVFTVFLKKADFLNLKSKVDFLVQHAEDTAYNMKGLFDVIINKGSDTIDSTKMFCSQFVDSMFKLINVDLTDKKANLVTPKDLSNIKNKKVYKVYEGTNGEYDDRIVKRNLNSLFSKAEYIKESIEPIIYEVREPIKFTQDGDLIIKKPNSIDFNKEYMKSKKVLATYKKHNDLDGMKYEVCKLWYLNTILMDKIEKSKKEEYVEMRAKILTEFSVALNYIIRNDSSFNFEAYYQESPFGDADIKISSSTLSSSISLLKSILR